MSDAHVARKVGDTLAVIEDLLELAREDISLFDRQFTLEAMPLPLHWYILPPEPQVATPQASWPRC